MLLDRESSMSEMKYKQNRIQSRLDIIKEKNSNMKTYQWKLSKRKHRFKNKINRVLVSCERTLSSIIHAESPQNKRMEKRKRTDQKFSKFEENYKSTDSNKYSQNPRHKKHKEITL